MTATKVITITLVVEVDESVWDHVYGDDDLWRGVADYVVANLSQSAAAEEGTIVSAEVIGR
jgi:hypothetical protein